MTSDHRRARIGYLALVMAVVAAAPAAAEIIASADLEAAELVAELPWTFEVTVEPGGEEPVRTTRHRFKSTAPIEKTAAGNVYLRAELTTYEHGDTESAQAAFDDVLAGADPVIGLSYAWDRLLRSGAVVYHLHAGCTWSEENFQRVAARLEAAAKPPDLRVACRCGGGCKRGVDPGPIRRGADAGRGAFFE